MDQKSNTRSSTLNTEQAETANIASHDQQNPLPVSTQEPEQGSTEQQTQRPTHDEQHDSSEQPSIDSPRDSQSVLVTSPRQLIPQGSVMTHITAPESGNQRQPVTVPVTTSEELPVQEVKTTSAKESERKFTLGQEAKRSKSALVDPLFEALRNTRRRPYRKKPGQKSPLENIAAIIKANDAEEDKSDWTIEQYLQGLNLDPRRVADRDEKLAEQEALEQARREAEEKARVEKEDAEFQAQLARERQEYIERNGIRQMTTEPIIAPLTAEQEERVKRAVAKGQKVDAMNNIEITSRDWKTLLPTEAWLNDNIINAYLDYVVQMAHDRVGLKRNEAPKMHAFNNNFYNNLSKNGYTGVQRWGRRAKIGGKTLLSLDYIFIPVNADNNHWTLAVISPARRTLEYFDSLHMTSKRSTVFSNVKAWLKGELGDAYVQGEWRIREDPSPHQGNMSDCGVHTITTAKLIALGIDPMAAPAAQMPLQRRRIVAELLNSGFHGEFEPVFSFA